MGKKIQFYGLDITKFICALLVIMIHTAPFIEVAPNVNFYLVQVMARIAVPFFFLASGFLFFMKLNQEGTWKDEENLDSLKHYLIRIGILYLCWSAVYFLFTLVSWLKDGFQWVMLARYVRDFFFTGSCYHLWFLPSLMVGMVITYFLYFKGSRWTALISVLMLYFLGMLINVYGALLLQIPVISTVYKAYTAVFVTSRNGLFFAPLFLLMGAYFATAKSILTKRDALIGLLISFVLLALEATMLRNFHYMNDLTSMYLFLIPLEFFLFSWVVQLQPKEHKIYPFLRKSSLLIYVSHILFVMLLTLIWKMLFHTAIGNLPLYLLTTICSLLFAGGCIYAANTKLKWLKVFY